MNGLHHDIDPPVDGSPSAARGPRRGELLADRYRVERRIGSGSMGTVYAAHDQAVDEPIALKLLDTSSDDALTRFRQEVRLARRVTHRNAARTFDLCEYGDQHFITMELIEGQSLRVHLTRKALLEPARAVALARQLCLGLHAAHQVQVLHRDLKPSNVLIERSGRAVITDFGIACSIDPSAELDDSQRSLAGTPAYMAPEQVRHQPLDGRADLYALGVVLFEMLTGTTPWSGDTPSQVAVARLREPPPDPRDVVELPEWLATLVQQCMAQEPARRPASLEQLEAQLARGASETSATLELDTAPPPRALDSAFAPLAPAEHALAIMPFRYRGPPADAYLVEPFTDELVNLLSMTRGLQVSARGATVQFREERDAQSIGRALGVDVVVDGSIQRAGAEVRIVTRLVDVSTGFQKWSERFTGRLGDVLDLRDRMAKRIAEALRVELVLQRHGAVVSAEAIEPYLRGRASTQHTDVGIEAVDRAIRYFEQAQAVAPTFVLPLAARADATVMRWFLAAKGEGLHWAKRAREAVNEALEHADGLAETHLAAARLQVNRGDFREAAHHLSTALRIAPTYAAAHEYLGILQCDMGRGSEGAQRIILSHELDPMLGIGTAAVLRHYALRGEREAFESLLRRARRRGRSYRFGFDLFEFRVALWHHDHARARRVRWSAGSHAPVVTIIKALEIAIDKTASDAEVIECLEAATTSAASPRLRTAWGQLSTEILALRGMLDQALATLVRTDASNVLLDTDWLESCPALVALRARPEFVAIRDRVRQRADDLWDVGPAEGHAIKTAAEDTTAPTTS